MTMKSRSYSKMAGVTLAFLVSILLVACQKKDTPAETTHAAHPETQKADATKMAEGVKKFADPQKALLDLVEVQRASLAAG